MGVEVDSVATPSPKWFLASSLTERLAALSERDGSIDSSSYDEGIALRRLERWRCEKPFAGVLSGQGEQLWNERLTADQLSEDRLRQLLGESPEALAHRGSGTPSWLQRLLAIYQRPATGTFDFSLLRGISRYTIDFLFIAEPLILDAVARLRGRLTGLVIPFLGPDGRLTVDPEPAIRLLVPHLGGVLLALVRPTLLMELQIARLENRLTGESAEERFRSYIEPLRQPEKALAVLESTPLLGRQLLRFADQWVEFAADFFSHLAADAGEIERRFFSGRMVRAERAGDPHRGGRTALILTFEDNRRLVYKARSLAVDVSFQSFVDWCNIRGFEPELPRLEVLDGGDHGWVGFVEPGPCADLESARRFYRRQGGWLALFHLLGAVDFHHENIIAAGEDPVPVDLETLFHPPTERLGLAPHPIDDNLLRVGLLPSRSGLGGEIDLSGLGAGQEQSLENAQVVEGDATDDMRIARRAISMPRPESVPRIGEETLAAVDFTTEIEAGFRDLYGIFELHRDELGAENGPLMAFAGTEVRVVVRPTWGYGYLRARGFHPHQLADALVYQRTLDHLWLGVDERPALARLIPAETRALEQGDIPRFVTRPESRHLWTGDGERLPELFDRAGLAAAKARLAAFGPADLERQTWTLRQALVGVAIERGDLGRASYRLEIADSPAPRRRYLEQARRVGERLASLAYHPGDDRATHWIGLQRRALNAWSATVVGADLYNGLGGIALTLAQLGAVLGDDRFTELAHGALEATREMTKGARIFPGIGAWNGWGGWIYVLAHLGALWNEPELFAEAEAAIPKVEERLADDRHFDLVTGAAGAVMSLSALHRASGSSPARRAAVACGEHLLAHARPAGKGIGWVCEEVAAWPICGFSHGAAGIAWALARLAAVTDETRFLDTASAAIAFEREHFSSAAGNWRDLRPQAPPGHPDHADLSKIEERFATAWCHGAVGIGLARLDLVRSDGPRLEGVEAEIEVALVNTFELGFGRNHCLCHGDLGNLELLLERVRRGDGETGLEERVARLAAGILNGIEKEGWLYGLQEGAEPLGLMVGLAGVGYGLLRLADNRVPSVLLLQIPGEVSRETV